MLFYGRTCQKRRTFTRILWSILQIFDHEWYSFSQLSSNPDREQAYRIDTSLLPSPFPLSKSKLWIIIKKILMLFFYIYLQVVNVKDMAWILERAAHKEVNLRVFDDGTSVSYSDENSKTQFKIITKTPLRKVQKFLVSNYNLLITLYSSCLILTVNIDTNVRNYGDF